MFLVISQVLSLLVIVGLIVAILPSMPRERGLALSLVALFTLVLVLMIA